MYCHKCERAYDANAEFCNVCGLPLSLNEATPQFRGSPSRPASMVSNPATNSEGLRGLGGWLILVGFGLIVGMVLRAFLILQNVRIASGPAMRTLSNPHSAGYIPGYSHLMQFELGCHIFFLALNIALAIYFVRESRVFPRLFMVFLALSAIYGVMDHFLLMHAVAGSSQNLQQRLHETLANGLSRIIGSAAGAILWICYMLRSERVKVTFVN